MHFKDLTPPGTTESHLKDTKATVLDHSWTRAIRIVRRAYLRRNERPFEAAYALDPDTSHLDMDVEVRDNTATLRGIVRSIEVHTKQEDGE